MLRYPKNKFFFTNQDGSKLEPKNGEYYANNEFRAKRTYPFFQKDTVIYELVDDYWVEYVNKNGYAR